MADSQMEAVKRAYAEVMLNTAKESAARVLRAERRAAALAGGLAAAKDDAVAALLRLKAIMHSQIKEVEMQSLDHVKRIEELEMQLQDAQNTIASLQAELQGANAELEQTRKTLGGENRNCLYTSDMIDYSENNSSHSKMHLRDGSRSPATPAGTYKINKSTADGTCCVPRNRKEIRNMEKSENLPTCSPDLASFIIRQKEPELYRNGCTQRIRALEQHCLSVETPLEESGELASELKSDLIIGKNGSAKNPQRARSIVEEILQTNNLTNYKRRRGSRSKRIPKHAIYSEQGKAECKPSDTSNTNGCMLLLRALDSAKVLSRQGGKQFNDVRDDLLIGRNEGALDMHSANHEGKDILQIKTIQMQKRKRSKTIAVMEAGSSDSKGVLESGRTPLRATNENIMLDGRLSSETLENHSDTPGVGGPLRQCTTETITSQTVAKPSQFDSDNTSPVALVPTKNEIGDDGNLPADCSEWRAPGDNTVGQKEVNKDEICNLDSDKADAPIANSVAKEENAKTPCGIPIQAEGAPCIKYTFNRRKRKSVSLDNTTESALPQKSSSPVTPAKKQEPETKPQIQYLLTESPRSNRQLVQVARQLISLSGKKW